MNGFQVDCAYNNYVLNVGEKSSAVGGLTNATYAGDAFNAGGMAGQNQSPFSTLDKDNDLASQSCAQTEDG